MDHTKVTFEAIGTRWEIDYLPRASSAAAQTAFREIMARVEQFDACYSRFRPDSLITRMAQCAGVYTLPIDAEPLFALYRQLYDITNGAFTPLIGQTMVDAGYDATYSLQSKPLTVPPLWDDAMTLDFPTLTLHKPALLDFGAAGKGYLVDMLADILLRHGITDFCVDGSGDMRYATTQGVPLRVGLENPTNIKQVIGVATLHGGSICGSAGNRRAWGNYHHTIDPRTLTSPRDVLATWVVAETAMIADALATCLFLVPPEQLTGAYRFSYLLLNADFTVRSSQDFPAELFTHR